MGQMHTVEVRWRAGNGDWRTENVEIEDTNGTAGIQDDEVQAQAEAALRRRMEANLGPNDGQYLNLPGAVTVDRYRYDTDTTRAGNQWSTNRTFSSPLTFNIGNVAERMYGARVLGSPRSEADIDFRSDGTAGASARESYDVMEGLFRHYGVSYSEYLTNPGILEGTERGRQLRDLINNPNAKISMGSDGVPGGIAISRLDSTARGDSRVPASARTGGATGADSANPAGAGTPDPTVTAYINDPNPNNASRLRADRARTDELINILIAALSVGDTSVLTTAMQLVAKNSRSTVAENAMSTIAALRTVDRQIGELNTQIQGLNSRLSSTDQAQRATATTEFQRLQLQMSQLNSQRQMIVSNLETAIRQLEEINKSAERISDGMYRANNAGR